MVYQIEVTGAVQGIGYRPFTAALAEELHITGDVRNAGGIVHIRACGTETSLRDFVRRLKDDAPFGALVLSVGVTPSETATDDEAGIVDHEDALGIHDIDDEPTFRIISSTEEASDTLPVFQPDLGICPDCLREMKESGDRRYRYPLISCVSCGPRWSILDRFPYDRDNTSMQAFAMCPRCREEYTGTGRRRHAQTISCHDCGPQMRLNSFEFTADQGKIAEHTAAVSVDTKHFVAAEQLQMKDSTAAITTPEDDSFNDDDFNAAVQILRSGGILALQAISGFQLLCSSYRTESVRRLRRLKGREEKPFAVIFPSVESIQEYCIVSQKEKEVLESAARPIVLLERRQGASIPAFSEEVCRESRYIGAFLPASGVQQLLCDACGPLIATSANRSGNLIPISLEELQIQFMDAELKPDAVYWNDRPIRRPLDDSVTAVVDGKLQMIRRSRGYVPLPVFLRERPELPQNCSQRVILAAGADLKAAFALRQKDRVILSPYFGDLENYSVMRSYSAAITDMEQLLGVQAQAVICDMHPGYFSVQSAKRLAASREISLYQVQHHHAHIASVMAEHGLTSCIGVAFDGTGYGTDGQLWGGEFLYCRGSEFERSGHLSGMLLAGGDQAGIHADIPADCCRISIGLSPVNTLTGTAVRMKAETIISTSMGRLFDAVAAILDICHENSYEGECAILLENAAQRAILSEIFSTASADTAETVREPMEETVLPEPENQREQDNSQDCAWSAGVVKQRIVKVKEYFPQLVQQEDGCFLLSHETVIRGVIRMREDGFSADRCALAFHDMITCGTVEICREIRKRSGENQVALSGGTFANRILLRQCKALLEEDGFDVYRNEQVPCNDGGISLGQAYIGGMICV